MIVVDLTTSLRGHGRIPPPHSRSAALEGLQHGDTRLVHPCPFRGRSARLRREDHGRLAISPDAGLEHELADELVIIGRRLLASRAPRHLDYLLAHAGGNVLQRQARRSQDRQKRACVDRVRARIGAGEPVERLLAGGRRVHHEGAFSRLNADEPARAADRAAGTVAERVVAAGIDDEKGRHGPSSRAGRPSGS